MIVSSSCGVGSEGSFSLITHGDCAVLCVLAMITIVFDMQQQQQHAEVLRVLGCPHRSSFNPYVRIHLDASS